MSNGDQTHTIAGLAMKGRPSVDFSGYWQRHLVEKSGERKEKRYA
jgi:hypothetical protein